MSNKEIQKHNCLMNIGYLLLGVLFCIPVLGTVLLFYILIFKRKFFENKMFRNIFKVITIVLLVVQICLTVIIFKVTSYDIYYYLEGYKYQKIYSKEEEITEFNSNNFYRFALNQDTISGNRAIDIVEQARSIKVNIIIDSKKLENDVKIDEIIQIRKYYVVTFEYDVDGFINTVILNVKDEK